MIKHTVNEDIVCVSELSTLFA